MTDEIDSLLRLAKKQIKPAAATLARAFQEYPVSVFFLPDAGERRKRQPLTFRSLVRSGIKYGEVYTTSARMEGVAVWFSPDSRRESFWDKLISGRFLVPLFEGAPEMARQRIFMEYATAVRAKYVPSRHWYLQLLGVDPVYQGQGYAGKLLKPMLARADRDGLPCFLETQMGKNVGLYEHFGFRVAEAGIIPGSNVKSWAMVRNAS
ncbi:MAG: GNAT family N-acetyltransferase [Dehalococcoidales bacterium]|jgi:GNAT superfamily N-acetyltransferase